MRKKNKKREKIFAVNYRVAPELLHSLDQMAILVDSIARPLKRRLTDKGYKPTSSAMMKPYSDIIKDTEKDLYQISIKAIYVGKKKAKEEN